MKKVFFLLFALASFALADELDAQVMLAAYSAVGAGIAIGVGACGGAIGMGHASSAAISGMARNPGLSGSLTKNMFVVLAIIEAQVLYAFVVVLILLYANPFMGKIFPN